MRLLDRFEIDTIYKPLFKAVFGYYDENQIPRTVIIHEKDGKAVGFASGYLFNRDTFYLQFGGTLSNFISHLKFWKEGEQWFLKHKVRYLTTVVENKNTAWQRTLMKIGFIPFGLKVTQGKIFLEYWKELK